MENQGLLSKILELKNLSLKKEDEKGHIMAAYRKVITDHENLESTSKTALADLDRIQKQLSAQDVEIQRLGKDLQHSRKVIKDLQIELNSSQKMNEGIAFDSKEKTKNKRKRRGKESIGKKKKTK